jgi:hypothetical protein
MPIVKTFPSGSSSSSSDCCPSNSTPVVSTVVLLQSYPHPVIYHLPDISHSSSSQLSSITCCYYISHLPRLGEPSVGLAPQTIRTLASGNRLTTHCSSAFSGTATTRGTCRSGPSILRLCSDSFVVASRPLSLPLDLSHHNTVPVGTRAAEIQP